MKERGSCCERSSCTVRCRFMHNHTMTQERFRDLIVGFPSVVSTAKTLAATAAALSIPLVVTEQYPKVFKPTVHELGPWLRSEQNPNGAPVFAKLKFSMMVPEVRAHVASVREHGVTDYILFGIEAHVCVQHTALDLLREGANVHIVVDGVSSQRRGDRAVALRLLQSSGAILTTTESIIFSLLGSAEHPAFKAVQPIVIAHNKGRSELLEMSA